MSQIIVFRLARGNQSNWHPSHRLHCEAGPTLIGCPHSQEILIWNYCSVCWWLSQWHHFYISFWIIFHYSLLHTVNNCSILNLNKFLILESCTLSCLSTPSTWLAPAPSNYYSPRMTVSRNTRLFSPLRVISYSNKRIRLVIATLQLKFKITTAVSKRSVGSKVDFSKEMFALEVP